MVTDHRNGLVTSMSEVKKSHYCNEIANMEAISCRIKPNIDCSFGRVMERAKSVCVCVGVCEVHVYVRCMSV